MLHTRPTMETICRRTGLTAAESLLRPTYNGMPILSDSSFRESRSIDPDVTRRGELLTPAQTSAIEEIAMGLYRHVASRYGIAVTSRARAAARL